MRKIILSLFALVLLSGIAFGESTGTGFFITDNGVLVTCAHCVEGGSRITVTVDGTEYPAELLSLNSELDLAILKINYRNPYHFKLGDFTTVNLGDKLSVLGFPLTDLLSRDIRYTEGTLSARSGLKDDALYFQHSAPTHPGNSGGPIMNSSFEVVGVAAAVMNDESVKTRTGLNPQNINFGVPIGFLTAILDNIRPGAGNIRNTRDAEKATVLITCYSYGGQGYDLVAFNVTVVNQTGYKGQYLYISPSSSDSWGDDMLGNDILSNGRSVTLRELPSSDDNYYDLRLVDEDEASYYQWNVRLNPNQTIAFTFADFERDPTEGNSSGGVSGPSITVVNDTGFTVYYLYISPSSSDSWGDDWLASNQVLKSGESVTVRLPGTGRYDFLMKDLDGDTYTKYNKAALFDSQIVFTFDDFDN